MPCHHPPAVGALLAATLAAAAGLPAQRPDSATLAARAATVERFVARHHARLGLPGVAVSVATPNGLLLAAGFGTDERTGERITGRTPIYIGSVTKTLTAAAVASLAAADSLDLDAPVERELPGFRLAPPFVAGSITPRHLLHHRSGLRQWSGHDGLAQREGRVSHIAPRRTPGGGAAEYSSLNYLLLGQLVTAASGEPYASYLRSVLFAPIGMSDAFVAGRPPEGGRAATGHQSYFGLQRRLEEPLPPHYLIPAGFVAASATDLGRFSAMLLNDGVVDGRQVFDASTARAILSPMDSAGPAMAWGRWRLDGRIIHDHAGNARGSSARVRLDPEYGYAISIVANTNSGPFFSATGDLMDGIVAILGGHEAPSPWPRERLFKGVLLVGTALSLGQLYSRGRAWDRAGRPTTMATNGATLAPLAFDVVGGTFLLVGLPRLIGVPLGTMTEYFPDLGIALITSASAGMVGGVLRGWTRSAR